MKTAFAVAVVLNAAVLFAAAVPANAQGGATEKCYGVAKAGKNDCQTKHSSCAATSKKDAQADAWLSVPTGTCEKIVGGKLTSSQS
jgi:uncharacterized membrane protein